MKVTEAEKILIRVDASSRIGLGHLMRTLALAEAWQDAGGRALFVLSEEALHFRGRLVSEGMETYRLKALPGSMQDASETAAVAAELAASWVVLDGYHFDGPYQRRIRGEGFRLFVIDDEGRADPYWADVILNQNPHAEKGLYPQEKGRSIMLLGPSYVLLRREFIRWKGWSRTHPAEVRRILVTLGGGENPQPLAKVIDALRLLDREGLEASVVMGLASCSPGLVERKARSAGVRIRFVRNVSDMAGLMAGADVAVSAGGTTALELAFMGVPAVILVLAENQEPTAMKLDAEDAAICIGWQNRVSPEMIAAGLARLLADRDLRQRMSRAGRRLVDGEGATRVIRIMRGHF